MRVIDRLMRRAVAAGVGARSTSLLETIGRVSGLARVTPVANGQDGDMFWLVTEHGRRAQYVRNIEANPNVRVKVGRRWRRGRAQIVDDDPSSVMDRIAAVNPRARGNLAIVKKTGSEHLVVRIPLSEG